MTPGQQEGGTTTTAEGRLRLTVIEDAAVQAAMQPWVEMECYQLARGRRLGRMDNLDLGSQQVVRERQIVAVQKLGVTPPDLCTISCCTLDPTFRFSEVRPGGVDTVFLMPENTEFDVYVPAGAQTHYVSFRQDEFLKAARALDPAQWERTPRHLLSIHATRQASLEAAVSQWLKAAGKIATADSSLVRRMLLQDILTIVTAIPREEQRPPPLDRSRAFHICRAACAFVEESLADDVMPTIVDICTRIGVSKRTLQYAFRTYIDMSPLAYLRLCRLNRVHAVLRASDPHSTTVTEAATRFGFFHLGRFALDYRKVFDKTPSATLAS